MSDSHLVMTWNRENQENNHFEASSNDSDPEERERESLFSNCRSCIWILQSRISDRTNIFPLK